MQHHIIAHPPAAMLARSRQALRRLVAAVPTDCPACGGAACGGGLCDGCRQDARMAMLPLAPRCGRCALRLAGHGLACPSCVLQLPSHRCARTALDYAPPYDGLIMRFKAQRQLALGRTLAGLVQQALEAGPCLPGGPLQALVAVPASLASLRRRGFNPAGELAAALAAGLGVPRLHGVLSLRHEVQRRQATLDRRARRQAAQGRYLCQGSLAAMHVALVDDVMTTGSTAEAASQALLEAGAAQVTVLVAARTPWPGLAQ